MLANICSWTQTNCICFVLQHIATIPCQSFNFCHWEVFCINPWILQVSLLIYASQRWFVLCVLVIILMLLYSTCYFIRKRSVLIAYKSEDLLVDFLMSFMPWDTILFNDVLFVAYDWLAFEFSICGTIILQRMPSLFPLLFFLLFRRYLCKLT